MKAKPVRHEKVTDESGNTVEIRIWQVPRTEDKPQGYKYSLVYIADGERAVGYDNAEGKGETTGIMPTKRKHTGLTA